MIDAILGDTGLRVPRLVFGCAPMMGRVGRRASLRALGAAFDRGLNYFDVARAYGYGEAEGLLGEFIAGRRDRVVIATKAGILPRGRASIARQLLKPAARLAFSLLPGMRMRMRAALGSQFTGGQFSAESVRASLEESLRRLGTDYVDILFLHECSAEAVRDEALLAELRRFVEEGKVRWCGVSTTPEAAQTAGQACSGLLRVLQFPYGLLEARAEELLLHEPTLARSGKIAFQPFGGESGVPEVRSRIERAGADPEIAAEIRDKLRGPAERVLAHLCLGSVLSAEGMAAAVCSMFTVEHIDANIEAVVANRFSPQEIQLLRRRIRTEPARVP